MSSERNLENSKHLNVAYACFRCKHPFLFVFVRSRRDEGPQGVTEDHDLTR